MASQQPNAWQTTSRSRNSNSASRTPNRSETQSPSQQVAPSQPPRQDGGRVQQPPPNVWAQRSSVVSTSNGPAKTEVPAQVEESFQSLNGFNSADVKAFLSRDVGVAATYKPADVDGTSARSSGGAWGSSNMANNQSFFVQLAKQVATVEGGG